MLTIQSDIQTAELTECTPEISFLKKYPGEQFGEHGILGGLDPQKQLFLQKDIGRILRIFSKRLPGELPNSIQISGILLDQQEQLPEDGFDIAQFALELRFLVVKAK